MSDEMDQSGSTRRGPAVLALLAVAILIAGVLVVVRQFGDDGSDPRAVSSASSAKASASASASRAASTKRDRSASKQHHAKKRGHSAKGPAAASDGSATVAGYRAPARFSKREAGAGRVAAAGIDDFLRASSTTLNKPSRATSPDLDKLSTGAARGEVVALQIQYREMHYRVVGSPRVVSSELRSIHLDKTPPTATLAVCLDSSKVDVLDPLGRSMKKRLYAAKHPVLNLYGLTFRHAKWQVVSHSIPTDSACGRTHKDAN